MKPPRTCLLLLNGNRARFVFNSGPGKGLELHKEGDMTGSDLHGRDIYADRPGRTFDRKGAGRHAKEYSSDPALIARQHFLEDVVKRLKAELKAEEFSRLIVVAPPKVSAQFIPLLPSDLSEIVYAELQKDLTQVPIGDLPRHLESIMVL